MNLSLNTLLSSAALVIASTTAFSALAQSPPAPAAPGPAAPAAPAASSARAPGKGFRALDANHDRMISREEARSRPGLSKNFDAIDTDKDGQLSRAELKAYRQAHKGEGKGKT